MSTLSWNCHGLGTPWALQFLKESILQKRPDFVFLTEILCKANRVERVKEIVGFEGAFPVDTQGHNGGIALLWRNSKEVTVLSYKLEGYPYTWESGYETEKWMEIRLDRALVSNSFVNQFEDAKLTNMKITTSYHSPILLEPFVRSKAIRVQRLRFENAWLRDPMCGNIVEESWQINQGR
ncbi:hypothetical protein POM88_000038 [Heracleum sosnowskyi]|uniref:Endonuclease/exonuclease/phosphatase domain-containing protein n=1 Tax=Heracleum sosnowskyi TaxID=360622 RepID=A0AAD8JAP4_9APIA|nr:hypothetical protein POM88_000038 [Heracleum sosnowskyi]